MMFQGLSTTPRPISVWLSQPSAEKMMMRPNTLMTMVMNVDTTIAESITIAIRERIRAMT